MAAWLIQSGFIFLMNVNPYTYLEHSFVSSKTFIFVPFHQKFMPYSRKSSLRKSDRWFQKERVEIYMQACLWTCGRGEVTLTLSQPGGQIMPTIYWCPVSTPSFETHTPCWSVLDF